MENKLKKNRLPVDAIMDCIREGTTSKTELIATAAKNSGISKTKVTQALMDHTGPGELSATDTEHRNLFYGLSQRCLTKDGVYEDVRQKLAEREWVA